MKLLLPTSIAALAFIGTTAIAQSSTSATYGARLANPTNPTAVQNQRRINNRINSRIASRIANRIEKYQTAEPTAALQRAQPSASQAVEQATIAVQQPVPEQE